MASWQAWFYQSGYLRCRGRAPISMTSAVVGKVQVSRLLLTAAAYVPPPPPPAVRPSGAGYTRYEDIQTGSLTFQQVLNAVPSGNVLTLPLGTFQFSNFANGYVDGVRIGSGGATGCKGIAGSGRGTIIQMTPNSSTKQTIGNDTSAGATNPCYLLNLSGTASAPLAAPVLQNFSLYGTAQGHYYNGISLAYCNDAMIDGLYLLGASPGFSNYPPGETFGIGQNHSDRMTVKNTEVDGRNSAGTRICASAIGWNNSRDAYVYDTYVHHALTGMITWYNTINITTQNLRSEYNGSGGGQLAGDQFNHEGCNGAILHTNPTMIADRAHGNSGLHMSLNSQTTDAPNVRLVEPTFDPGPDSGGCFALSIADNYGAGQKQTTLPTIIKGGRTLTWLQGGATGNAALNAIRYH